MSKPCLQRWAPGGAALLSRVLVTLALFAAPITFAAPSALPVLAQADSDDQPREVQEFDLTAAPMKWEIQPGLVVDAWGYNGQVPGPELRFHEGALVRIHLHNRLPVPTTIHWHGIDVPLNMDGVPGISQPPVMPGEDFTYEFVATNPGTRWYHSHVDSNAQQELGLYGSVIVEPREPGPTYDREFTYMLDEKALDFTPDVAMGKAQIRNRDAGNGRGGDLQYDVFMFNGKAGDAIPPLTIGEGERILVRLINAGNLAHPIHLHGHSFKIVATDGNPVPPAAQLVKDTVLVAPGERYDLEVDGTNPGVWMFHCHIPNHQENGMMTALVYDGFTLPSQHDMPGISSISAAPAPASPPSSDSHQTSANMPGMVTLAPTPTAAAAPQTGSAPSGANMRRAEMQDNRFEPNPITVPVGTTVTWASTGLNLHTVTAFDGSFDSGTVSPSGSWSYTFSTPGEYRYYCRQHLLNGMLGVVRVQ